MDIVHATPLRRRVDHEVTYFPSRPQYAGLEAMVGTVNAISSTPLLDRRIVGYFHHQVSTSLKFIGHLFNGNDPTGVLEVIHKWIDERTWLGVVRHNRKNANFASYATQFINCLLVEVESKRIGIEEKKMRTQGHIKRFLRERKIG